MNQMSDATRPLLRIRANASENVKGIVSCEATVELVDYQDNPLTGPELSALDIKQNFIAQRIEYQLRELHIELRSRGHKLAVDGGA